MPCIDDHTVTTGRTIRREEDGIHSVAPSLTFKLHLPAWLQFVYLCKSVTSRRKLIWHASYGASRVYYIDFGSLLHAGCAQGIHHIPASTACSRGVTYMICLCMAAGLFLGLLWLRHPAGYVSGESE